MYVCTYVCMYVRTYSVLGFSGVVVVELGVIASGL